MDLATAQHYAAKIVDWLSPHCEHIEIAGSIRRERPVCNDVDIVCIPKIREVKDMFGTVTSTENLLWQFLVEYVRESRGLARFQSGGERPGKQAIVMLPKCQLDLWYADRENFATRFLCRTGSKEHNIWFAQEAKDQGLDWKPYEGLFRDGELRRAGTESMLYGLIGKGFIPPKHRESDWIKENVC